MLWPARKRQRMRNRPQHRSWTKKAASDVREEFKAVDRPRSTPGDTTSEAFSKAPRDWYSENFS
jgi:hypothetical protein